MSFFDNIPKWLKFSLKLALTIAAIAFVIFKVDFEKVFLLISNSKWWLLIPAILFFILSKVFASFRLNIFFKDIGIQISKDNNLKLYWLGMFYNLFLPGGIGGDGYKVVLLQKKYQVGIKRIIEAVLLDRVSGLLALLILALLLSISTPLEYWYFIIIYALIPLGYLVYTFLGKKLFPTYYSNIHKTTLLSFLVQLFQVISVFFIIQSLGIEESQILYLFIFLLSSIVATIPFTVGGIGARELTFLYAAKFLQLDSESAISVSFIFFTITALVSLYGLRYNLTKDFDQQITKDHS